MSNREHDIERGPGSSQINTGMPPPHPTAPRPMRSVSIRETAPPSSPPAQPLSRPFPISRYPSQMLQDSPILAAFRYHIGIHNDPSLSAYPTQPQSELPTRNGASTTSLRGLLSTFTNSNTAVSTNGLNRPAPNIGIYERVIAAERKYHQEYQIFAILINGALGLQIIFAAALTALGAGNGPHTAVTAFGAMNTVLAGLLTFLKGSGLPNRLKYYENEWSKVREYIEQRERDFSSDVNLGRIGWEEMTAEIAVIEGMYEGVRQDIEANTPDSYVSMSNAMKHLSSSPGSHNRPSLAKGLSRLDSTYRATNEDVRHLPGDIDSRIRSGVSDVEHRASRGWSDLEKQGTIRVHEATDDMHDRARDASRQAEHRVLGTQQALDDSLRRAQTAAGSRVLEVQHSFEDGLQRLQGTAESRLNDVQSSVGETQHHVEGKAREMEEKIAMVAEKAAEKVLQLTRHRHS